MNIIFQVDEADMRSVKSFYESQKDSAFVRNRIKRNVAAEIMRVKKVAVSLLETLKTEKLRIDHWRDKEATRYAVRLTIQDFLWSDHTGLPVDYYSENDVQARADEVYRHVYRVYPTIPSPYYMTAVAA